MIVSASYRTDIPAFYAEWFSRRLEAGACTVINPYGGPVYEVRLDPRAVDGFVFWTRNAAPFAAALEAIAARGTPFVVQFTLTAYPRILEVSVPPVETALAQIDGLYRRYGPRVVVWRYDPILITSSIPPAWHLARFGELAAGLEGATDEVVVSFAQIYRKTARNLGRVARRAGLAWHDPERGEKRELLAELAQTAARHGMRLTLCTQPDLAGNGLQAAACIDARRLSDVAGHRIVARTKGNRPGCLCAQSRDIGAYDSCPHGCAYCYAVQSRSAAKQRYRAHDPNGEAITGTG